MYDGGSYRLFIDDEKRQLYGPSGLMWTRQQFSTDDGWSEVTRYADGSDDLIQWFKDGSLVQQQQGEENRYYSYDAQHRLEKLLLVVDETLEEVVYYSYGADSGQLLTIIRIRQEDGKLELHEYGILGDVWVASHFDDQQLQTGIRYPSGLFVQQTWNSGDAGQPVDAMVLEDGSLLVERTTDAGVVQETYNQEGLLVLEKKPSSTTEYQYNEMRLLKSKREFSPDGGERITYYEGERRTLVEQRMNGLVTKQERYDAQLMRIDTLYSEGKPYCDIRYESDGKRVLSITYHP